MSASLRRLPGAPVDFQDIVSAFAAREPGTDSFKQLQRDCTGMVSADPTNAALYFVVAALARAYWQRYEDEPVTVALADHGKALLLGYAHRMLGTLDRETEVRMSALNSIILDYQNANLLF